MSFSNLYKKRIRDIILSIILSILNSIAYRMGGSGNYPRWTRPVGVGLGVTAVLWLLFGFHWSILVSAGASAGISTTYFKKKGSEAKWYNWMFVGLALSAALLPWAILTHHILGFVIRSIVLTGLIIVWCQLIGNAVLEELGRGFLIIVTLLLFLFS